MLAQAYKDIQVTKISARQLVSESRLQIYEATFINISLHALKIYNTHVNSPFTSSEFLQLSLH